MKTRKSALTTARQYRTCPPTIMARQPEYQLDYDRHLSLCPHCSQSKMEEISGWERIVENIREIYPSNTKSVQRLKKPKAGQLRWIKHEFARWQDGYFYSSPLVLVLDTASEISDDILVAQTWHDPVLAGPGDLILLTEDTGLKDLDLFVETWNIYTLKASFLGSAIGKTLKKEVVDRICKMNRDPDYLPDWAVMPRPMVDIHDPRIYFREMEIAVGAVFSMPAVKSLLDAMSGEISVPDTMATITKFVPDAYWVNPPESIEETLALTRFRCLCAADGDETEILAKLAVFQKDMLCHFTPLKAYILQKQTIRGKLTISGRIVKPPAPFHDAKLISFLDVPGTSPLPAIRAELDQKTGSFYVEFETGSQPHGHLEIAVSHHLPPDGDT